MDNQRFVKRKSEKNTRNQEDFTKRMGTCRSMHKKNSRSVKRKRNYMLGFYIFIRYTLMNEFYRRRL